MDDKFKRAAFIINQLNTRLQAIDENALLRLRDTSSVRQSSFYVFQYYAGVLLAENALFIVYNFKSGLEIVDISGNFVLVQGPLSNVASVA